MCWTNYNLMHGTVHIITICITQFTAVLFFGVYYILYSILYILYSICFSISNLISARLFAHSLDLFENKKMNSKKHIVRSFECVWLCNQLTTHVHQTMRHNQLREIVLVLIAVINYFLFFYMSLVSQGRQKKESSSYGRTSREQILSIDKTM